MTDGHKTRRGRPRTKPEPECREDFLDAALGLFLNKGYERTSVEEITRSAGVAKGTFYLYFRSKGDLLLALRDRFREQGRARLEVLFADSERPFGEQVEALVDFAFDFYRENRAVFDLVYRRFPGELAREKEEARVRYAEPVAGVIRRAVERGEADTAGSDPRLFAYLILGAIEENVHSCLSSGEPQDLEALKEATKTFTRKALSAPRRG